MSDPTPDQIAQQIDEALNKLDRIIDAATSAALTAAGVRHSGVDAQGQTQILCPRGQGEAIGAAVSGLIEAAANLAAHFTDAEFDSLTVAAFAAALAERRREGQAQPGAALQ